MKKGEKEIDVGLFKLAPTLQIQIPLTSQVAVKFLEDIPRYLVAGTKPCKLLVLCSEIWGRLNSFLTLYITSQVAFSKVMVRCLLPQSTATCEV